MPKTVEWKPFHLRNVLLALGVSQRALAKRLGVDITHVRRFHSGKYTPSWTSAVAIAEALDVALDVFAHGDVSGLTPKKERKRS